MRYLMTVAYDGSLFKGYQKQPKERTVQGEIEKILKKISTKTIGVNASGRTDAGVHALNQKIHFDLEMDITVDKLKKSLNSLLPDDIYIKEMEVVKDDFHARFDVKAKEYIYIINMGEYNPMKRKYVYQYNKRLDIAEIQRALKHLEGTLNFKSFSKADDEKEDFVRTIIQTNLFRDTKNINEITLSFFGTGFLRYQVRNMIGLLIEIGEGKRKSEDVLSIIKAEDRTQAGITAPSEGLYLKDVLY